MAAAEKMRESDWRVRAPLNQNKTFIFVIMLTEWLNNFWFRESSLFFPFVQLFKDTQRQRWRRCESCWQFFCRFRRRSVRSRQSCHYRARLSNPTKKEKKKCIGVHSESRWLDSLRFFNNCLISQTGAALGVAHHSPHDQAQIPHLIQFTFSLIIIIIIIILTLDLKMNPHQT